MNKKECLRLIRDHFQINSLIESFKNPDFEIKSHIFFYRDIFKDIEEMRMFRVTSKNNDHIVFDIYYVSSEFKNLFHGYFRIEPVSDVAEEILKDVSKVCIDLGNYFYYVYQNSPLLKRYLISGNLENAIHQNNQDREDQFEQIKKEMYLEIASYKTSKFQHSFLKRQGMKKYIRDFIIFNKKCSEEVKMFLMSVLSGKYSKNVCFINNTEYLSTYISIDERTVHMNQRPKVSPYGFMDYASENGFVVFLRLEFFD